MNRNTLLSALVFITIALYSLSSAAQSPPMPPVFTENAPPSHTGSSYDLAAAIAEVPFAIELPATPVITSEAVCATEAEIRASLAVNGRRTIIAAGNYSLSTIYLGGSDKHIVFQPGVTLDFGTGSFRIENASRIRIDGSRGLITNASAEEILFRLFSSSDITIADVDFRNTGLGRGATISESGTVIARVVFVGVDLESSQSTIYVGPPGVEDFVIANSRIFNTRAAGAGNGWAIRYEGSSTRLAFLDSYFRAIENTVIRQGRGGTDIYYARNQIDYGSTWGYRTESTTVATRLSLINNAFYAILGPYTTWGGADTGRGSSLTNALFTGNTLRSPSSSPWFSDTTANPVTITSTPNPPAWEMQ